MTHSQMTSTKRESSVLLGYFWAPHKVAFDAFVLSEGFAVLVALEPLWHGASGWSDVQWLWQDAVALLAVNSCCACGTLHGASLCSLLNVWLKARLPQNKEQITVATQTRTLPKHGACAAKQYATSQKYDLRAGATKTAFVNSCRSHIPIFPQRHILIYRHIVLRMLRTVMNTRPTTSPPPPYLH